MRTRDRTEKRTPRYQNIAGMFDDIGVLAMALARDADKAVRAAENMEHDNIIRYMGIMREHEERISDHIHHLTARAKMGKSLEKAYDDDMRLVRPLTNRERKMQIFCSYAFCAGEAKYVEIGHKNIMSGGVWKLCATHFNAEEKRGDARLAR